MLIQVQIVDQDSAVLDYDGSPRPFGISRNHREIVKFLTDDDHGFKPAVFFLNTVAKDAVKARIAQMQVTEATPLPPNPEDFAKSEKEDPLGKLKTCDTVFLIDDSPSMSGKKWELVQKILEYSMNVATWYDANGIDVHFFNAWNSNQDNLKDFKKAKQILEQVDLRGDTPTYDLLCRHLDDAIWNFKENGRKHDSKNYNLIVLTDGEPNPEYESEDEISDPEDARKNKTAFRLIRKKVVETARTLDEYGARRGQLGIQFCQIGNDHDATVFFEYLDDRLKGKHKLKRDVRLCKTEVSLLLLIRVDCRHDKMQLGARSYTRFLQKAASWRDRKALGP